MARVIKCSFGQISGKLGNLVFEIRQGRQFVRSLPKKRTSPFSPEEVNAHLTFALLGSLYIHKLKPLIHKYWLQICKAKKLKMMPRNFFVKENFYPLIHSFPSLNKPFAENNMPNLSKIILTPHQGRLFEPTSIKNASCINNTLAIQWNPNTHCQGNLNDTANIIAIYLPPIKLFTPSALKILNPRRPIAPRKYPDLKDKIKIWSFQTTRKNGSFSYIFQQKINPHHLSLFLFFSNNHSCSQTASLSL